MNNSLNHSQFMQLEKVYISLNEYRMNNKETLSYEDKEKLSNIVVMVCDMQLQALNNDPINLNQLVWACLEFNTNLSKGGKIK